MRLLYSFMYYFYICLFVFELHTVIIIAKEQKAVPVLKSADRRFETSKFLFLSKGYNIKINFTKNS